jgi:hypothetical protein
MNMKKSQNLCSVPIYLEYMLMSCLFIIIAIMSYFFIRTTVFVYWVWAVNIDRRIDRAFCKDVYNGF